MHKEFYDDNDNDDDVSSFSSITSENSAARLWNSNYVELFKN